MLAKLEELAHDLEVEVSQSPAPDVSAQEKVLAQMRAHAVKLEDRRNRLYTLLEDGTYSREVFSERMQVLSGRGNPSENVYGLRQRRYPPCPIPE